SIDRGRKLPGRLESAAVGSCAHEIGVAEFADRPRAILFSARPEVAAREAAKHGGASCLRAFALQGVEDLLHRVTHCAVLPANECASRAYAMGSASPASLNPLSRS